MNTSDLQNVIIDIIQLGLFRVRVFSESGRMIECRNEADHLHNLPEILRSCRQELVRHYYDVERPSFLKAEPSDVEQFLPLWVRLESLIVRSTCEGSGN